MSADLHVSVLLNESIHSLNIQANGIYLDATFGRGGHSRLILNQLSHSGRLIAIDRDPQAQRYAQEFFTQPQFTFIATAMSQMAEHAQNLGVFAKINGILMDIGVSSPQLDDAERGFSFSQDGPLDMRMDNRQGITAAEWVNTATVANMTQVFQTYGEERFAAKIAQAIAQKRITQAITTTAQLSQLIADTVPFRDPHKHPATRCFQAIRIVVNDELTQLEQALTAALSALAIGGRLVVISFHSLEDRIVKNFMRTFSQPTDLTPDLPVPTYANPVRLRLIGKAFKASMQECRKNPRARSAVLRVAEKVQ